MARDPNIEAIYPLSPMQQGMLFHILADREPGTYFRQSIWSLPGDLDTASLRRAWQRVLDRHPILRTSFAWKGLDEPLQVVRKSLPLPWEEMDWRDRSAGELETWLLEQRRQGLDLTRAPLLRLTLIRTADDAFRLVWSFSQLLLDGWSRGKLLGEVAACYEAFRQGREPQLGPVRSYRDYIAWLRRQDLARSEAYWRGALAGLREPVSLPETRISAGPGRAVQVERQLALSTAASDALTGFARRHHLTPSTVVSGAWALVLARHARASEVVLGAVVSGRPADLPGVEDMVGMFINTLPMRVPVPPEARLAPWLLDLQDRQAALREHEHTPLVQVQRWSEVPAGQPLFESTFVYQNYSGGSDPGKKPAAETGTLREVASFEQANYPLGLTAVPGSGILLVIGFSPDRFDTVAMDRLLRHLEMLLEAFPSAAESRLSDLPILTAAERHQVLAEWNDVREVRASNLLVHEQIALQAREQRDRIAVFGVEGSLVYGELDRRANQLAHHLRSMGVGPETPVALCMERSLDLMIGLLGIFKSGGAYLPIDPEMPRERLALLLSDALGSIAAPVVVSQRAFAGSLDGIVSPRTRLVFLDEWGDLARWPAGEPPAGGAGEENLAYLIFTSGSTGVPKAVGVQHRNLRDILSASRRKLAWPVGARALCLAPFSFDIFLFEALNPLLAGGSCELFPLRPALDMKRLLVALADAEVVHAVPALMRQIVSAAEQEGCRTFDGVRTVFTGGDAVPQDLLVQLPRVFPNARLHVLYGPTESTILCSSHEVLPGTLRPWLGRPLPDTRIHLLDESLQPVPIGVPGEIFIGGAGVTRGYVARPSLSAERFIPDAFAHQPGARLYRSGDLARYLQDGSLQFLGRTDRQIKIRGFRIELGEIEAALRELPEVTEAAVLAQAEEAGEMRLVAYLVTSSGGRDGMGDLRSRLRQRLPDYMIPSDLVCLPAFPLTPHGKVDLRALPKPERNRTDALAAFVAPRTPLEDVVAAIWADVLGLERVGAEDDFFDLGGHSLIAVRLGSRLQQALGVELPLREIFDSPTVAGLTARLEGRMHDSGEETGPPPLRRVAGAGDIPLSYAQQRLWFLEQLEPGRALYSIPLALRLAGALDPAVLAAAFTELARRHETLRTRFAERDGAAFQEVLSPSEAALPILDLSGLGDPGREAGDIASREAERPFDLSRAPLWRSMLLRIAPEEHVVLLVLHHAISDGWSAEILGREMSVLYEAFAKGRPSPLPELPIQYADYACWQREWLRGDVLQRELAWWRERLEGAPELIALPTDRPRPAMPGPSGAVQALRLPEGLSRQLVAQGRKQGITPFMTALAGWSALLAVYTGQEDVTIGTPIAGRGRIELENLIGLFVNTLVVRADLSGQPSFRRLLERVRDAVLSTFAHQDLPFEKLVDELRPARDLSHTPLFQVMFALQAEPSAPAPMHDLGVRAFPVSSSTAKFDLALTIVESGGGWEALLAYRTELFDRATVGRMLRHYAALLEAAAAQPERSFPDLPILAPEELQALLVESGDGVANPAELVTDLFRHQAESRSDEPAILCENERLTYGELERSSNQLAHLLLVHGIGPDARVGILLDRSPVLPLAILAVFKAGGAYVPLDPELPAERLRFLLGDAGIQLVLTLERLRSLLQDTGVSVVCLDSQSEEIARRPSTAPRVGPDPTGAAYLIYTSGTTGTPKAVVVSHGNLAATMLVSTRRFQWSAGDRMPCLAPFSFDIFLFELLSPLLAGGACDLIALRPALNIDGLLARLRGCTALHAVPALMRQIVDGIRKEPDGHRNLRAVFVGGDAVPGSLLEDIRRVFPGARIWVLYGPTESTIICSSYEVPETGEPLPSPLGRPFAGARLLVSDAGWRPAPLGVAGEVWIGGGGVSRGYLGKPDLTAERFIPDPHGPEPGARLYRSGDLARRRPDGNLEFLGRADHQVKIRGFRIEPGEVEAALQRLAGVRQVVALARRDGTGGARLVAYIVAHGNPPSVSELRRGLAGFLPDYMIPAAFVFLESLPLTVHGKIDRRALPEPELARRHLGGDYVAPESRAERELAGIWSRLLRVERVGIHDNFFELGGDSILSIQIVAQARKAGLQLTPKQVFQTPTIAALAAQAGLAASSSEQGRVSGEVPLTPIQRHFFSLPIERPDHFNQAVLLELRRPLAPNVLRQALAGVMEHHDALRLRFSDQDGNWRQAHAEDGPDPWLQVDLSALPGQRRRAALEDAAQQVQASLDLTRGPLLRSVLFTAGPDRPDRLLWVIHHLVVDGVSWRILLDDLEDACRQLVDGSAVRLPPKTTSFKTWAMRLVEHARSGALAAERDHWLSRQHRAARLPADFPARAGAPPEVAGAVSVVLEVEETRALLQEVPAVFRTQINDALLAALALVLARWSGDGEIRIDLEGHGREELFEDVDLSRTVGWFTTIYPVALDAAASSSMGDVLRAVKERLRSVPRKGVGYGLLSWLSAAPEDSALRLQPAEVAFNYLGQLDQALPESSLFAPATESKGDTVPPGLPATHLLRIDGAVVGGRLHVGWLYSELLSRATVEKLADGFAEGLRAIIAEAREPQSGVYTPSDFPLARIDGGTLDRLLGADRTIEDLYPLSPMQRGLLFHALYSPESEAYFEQLCLELRGKLSPGAFRRACQQVLDRHSILRTSFAWEGLEEPLQIVRRHVELPWEEIDWRSEPSGEASRRLDELLAADRRRGLDPARAPLMRVSLIRMEEQVWRLVWSNHHILLDGWCLSLVFREVMTLYEAFAQGREAQLPQPRPYRDYIAWLRRQDLSVAERVWRRVLAGFTTPTSPGLKPPSPGQRGGASNSEIGERLGVESTARLSEWARRHRLTINTLVQGALALLLRQQSGQDDVLFGAVVSGRPPELADVESMVGLFINTLPVRALVDPRQRLLDWLEELQARQVELRQYEHSPLAEVQTWSEVPVGTPLFETLLVFENYPVGDSVREAKTSLSVGEIRSVEQTHYPVNLLVGTGEDLRLKLLFDPARLDGVEARRLLGRMATLLQGMAESPESRLEDVQSLSPAERLQLLADWSGDEILAPSDACLHDLFTEQVGRTPGSVALVHGRGSMTYGELDTASTELAESLSALGAGPEVRVGVCLDRTPALAIALLGVLKSGAAYVPLDPTYPRERIAWMLEDSGAEILLTRNGLVDEDLASGLRKLFLDPSGRAAGVESRQVRRPCQDNLSYVIYTSGSTGRPKGVAIRHGSAVTLVRWALDVFPAEDLAGVLASTSVCFDLSVFELFVPWSRGGAVVLAESALAGWPEAEAGVEVTLINTVPSVMAELLRLGQVPRSVRTINLAGEPLRGALVEEIHRTVPTARLFNLYGPSEDTTYSTWSLVKPDPEREPTLGQPIANTRAYVLDSCMRPVPVGVPGELFLGGDGLARGYLRRPDLTAERFVPDPFGTAGGRLYRTGDRVRHLTDGSLEFLGRLDNQVKLRGFRIELGEIEAALAAHPDIAGAAVLVREDLPGDRRLVGYVMPRSGEPSVPDLRTWLGERLPDFMIPSWFHSMPALPLTLNGKIDRKALPAPDIQSGQDAISAPPRTPMEEILSGPWSEILGREQVGIHDDFFALGGHSLLATRLVSRLRTLLGMELPLRSLFEHPTISSVATHLEELRSPGATLRSAVPILPVARDAYRVRRARLFQEALDSDDEVYAFPASHAQQRLWLLDQLEPGSPAYNILHGLRVEGELDLMVLRRTLDELVRRHETLRTSFARLEGELVQVVDPDLRVASGLVDLSALPPGMREPELGRLVRREALRPFDLGRAPLLRVLLARIEAHQHAVLFSIHHIVSDAWSMGVLVREVSALYDGFSRGTRSPLPEPRLQYADYAVFQRQWLQGTVLEEHLGFWKRRLAGDLPGLDLAPGRRRKEGAPQGRREMFLLSPELSQAVRELGRREGSTLFMTLLAAFQVLLCRCSGERDVVVGTAIANRNRSETESLIGFFINMLALRSDLSGNPTFRQFLRRVREETLGAFEHQDLPFDLLVQEVGQDGASLVRATFGVQNAPAGTLTLPGLRLTPIEFENGLVRYDLSLWMADSGECLSALWTYATDLFDAVSIGRLHKNLEAVLHRVTANPDLRLEDLELPLADLAGADTPRERPKLGKLREVKPRAVQVRVTS